METAYRDVQTHLTGEGGTSVKPRIGRLDPPEWRHVQAQRWVKVQNCTNCQSAKAGSRTATVRLSADPRDSRDSTLCSTSIKAKHSDPGWWTAARWRNLSEERLKEPGGKHLVVSLYWWTTFYWSVAVTWFSWAVIQDQSNTSGGTEHPHVFTTLDQSDLTEGYILTECRQIFLWLNWFLIHSGHILANFGQFKFQLL